MTQQANLNSWPYDDAVEQGENPCGTNTSIFVAGRCRNTVDFGGCIHHRTAEAMMNILYIVAVVILL